MSGARYYRADPGTIGFDGRAAEVPWWMASADTEVDGLRKAVVALNEQLDILHFHGHEDCPMPGEPGWPAACCQTCHAITLAIAINAESEVTA